MEEKLSDYLESLPLDAYCSVYFKRGNRMCPIGLIADKLGYDWTGFVNFSGGGEVMLFVYEKLQCIPVSTLTFDRIYDLISPQEAKDYAVASLREHDL